MALNRTSEPWEKVITRFWCFLRLRMQTEQSDTVAADGQTALIPEDRANG